MAAVLRAVPIVIVLSYLVTVLVGCRSITTHDLGTLFEATSLPVTGPVHARDILRLLPTSGTFMVTVNSGPSLRMSYKLVSQDGRLWIETLGQMRITYMQVSPGGGIEILEERALLEGVRVEYQPALPVLPARLEPGKPLQAVSQMTVLNLKDGQVREKGHVTYTVELVGRQWTWTPMGPVNCYILNMKRQVQLRMATSTVTVQGAYAPNQGLIGEREIRDTRVLGLIPVRREQQLRRVR